MRLTLGSILLACFVFEASAQSRYSKDEPEITRDRYSKEAIEEREATQEKESTRAPLGGSLSRDRSNPTNLLNLDARRGYIDFRALNEDAFKTDFRFFREITSVEGLDDIVLVTKDGREAQFRTGVELDGELYILSDLLTGREFVVNDAYIEGGKKKIVFSALDKDLEFIGSLERSDLALFDKFGRQQCIDLTNIRDSDVAIKIGLAIDISYSMSGYEKSINSALSQFFRQMPLNSICHVVEFNHEYDFVVNGESCQNISNSYSISGISGGTTAFPAMEELYKRIDDQARDTSLVIVLSDGFSDTLREDEAFKAKGDTTTLVNWLGSYNNGSPLSRFANAEVFGAVDKDGTIPYFFDRISGLITSQYIASDC